MFNIDAHQVLALTGPALYLAIFLLPFFQEDVAVISAATASLMDAGSSIALFGAILCGLTASDVWKYWLGYFARRNRWAHRFAEKPGVSVAGDLVRRELFKTLFAARYIPGTRIPTYVACGFFLAPYPKFVAIVVLTALSYVAVTFTLFHTIGEVAGENAKFWLPGIAAALLAGYLVYRWARRRNRAVGPLAPLSPALDHPMPEMPGFEETPLEGAVGERSAASHTVS
jgi:membrane protein DedA with SNARE-associated domain